MPGPTKVYAEMILASGVVGISTDLTLPDNTRCKWNARRLDYKCFNSNFRSKGDFMNCGMYRGVELLEHAMKIVVKVKVLRTVIMIYDMQFGFMPCKGTVDTVFI